jgi:DNA-binding SARP family transcriptional activator/tetratricopeptide (TPR) repeat protein
MSTRSDPATSSTQFHLWGPVTASRDGVHADLGPARQCCVVAVLLMTPGQPVALEVLVEHVWGHQRPERVRNVLATYVSRLRRSLALLDARTAAAGADVCPPGVELRYQSGGYLVTCVSEQVDLHRSAQLARRAREHAAAGRDEEADRLFAEALGLCAGEPLAGLKGDWTERTRQQMESERRVLLLNRLGVELRLRRHEALVPVLTTLVRDDPTDVRLVDLLMVALYRSGRRAEALATYREARRVSVDELGLEPGGRLRQLQRAILRGDPVPDWSPTATDQAATHPGPQPGSSKAAWPARAAAGSPGRAQPQTSPAAPASVMPRPAQLPASIGDFVGRVGSLSAVVQAAGHNRGAPGVPIVVTGVAGAGKTALVLRAAHQLRPEFPAGQLFAGLGATGTHPADPSGVLARFLRALGVPPALVPADSEERAALYRSLLADQRVLVVLDDACDEEQVRPLLPTGPGCRVLISSRRRLAGLEAASTVHLGTFDRQEAVELLSNAVGTDRIADDMAAAMDVCRLCGFLPLALRVAGARLARLPALPMAAFAAELEDERRRLDLLRAGDLYVRASLAVSYQRLADTSQRLLRRLGLLQAVDFTGTVAAAVLDLPAAAADQVLDDLVTASLIEVAGVDGVGQVRYRMHDIVRIFARERAVAEESAGARRSAVRRAIRIWLATAERIAASSLENAFTVIHGEPRCAPPRRASVDPPRADPAIWLKAELPNLVAAVEQAAREGMARLAWHLAGSLVDFFDVHGHYGDWRRTHTVALEAAERRADPLGIAVMVQGLGFLEMERDSYELALAHLARAEELFRRVPSAVGMADSAAGAAVCHRLLGQLDDASACAERADRLSEHAGYPLGRARAQFELGVVLREQGRYPDAVRRLEDALSLATAGGYRRAEGIVLRGLGIVYGRIGDSDRAIDCYERARAVLATIGDALRAAYATHQLAEAYVNRGLLTFAAPLLRQCIEVFQAQNDQYGTALGRSAQAKLHSRAGRPAEACTDLRAAVRIWHRLRMPLWEGRALRDLGDIHAGNADLDTAASTWRQALTILRTLRVPEADEVEERLTAASGHRRDPG